MLKPVHRLRGLNLRQSPINRPPEFARDLRNLEYTSRGELEQRWGYEEVGSNSGILDLFEYVGAENDPNRGSLLALKSDGLYRLNGTTIEAVPEGNASGQPTWTAQTKPVEYNKVLYWNDPDQQVDLWKYDGYSSHRAGVPKISISSGPTYAGTAGTYYFRVILSYTDLQGNVTWGDYQQYTGTADQITFTANPITNTYYDGFYSKYLELTGLQTINSSTLTLDTARVVSTNLEAGDYVRLPLTRSGATGFPYITYKNVKIDSIDGSGNITFNASDIGSDSFLLNAASEPGPSLEGRWQIHVFRSVNEFSNYEKMIPLNAQSQWGLSYQNAAFACEYQVLFDNTAFGAVTGGKIPLNLVYDDSQVRVLPPKGKYLALYNEQLFIGNVPKDDDSFGYSEILGNDRRLEDSIVWSDIPTLSNGSSVETFLVNNIRTIGKTSDGAIKAIFGNDDSFVVHKEKQTYYVNGDFITNSLRVRNALSEQNGAASHRSIKEVEGGHLYSTPKGIFLSAGGQKPVELSDIIEPLFTDDALSLGTLELENAKSVNDFLREKIYIYLPKTGSSTGYLLVYDYYWKEWLLHDNIPADAGFQDVGVTSTELYFATSTALYKRTLATKTDDLPSASSGINSYYWTGWFDMGVPSLIKKFQNLIIMSITQAWNATIKAYCDWDSSTVQAQNTLEFTTTQQVMDTQVFQDHAKAVSFRISNESDQSDMFLTAYEVQVEGTQTLPKGDL